MSKFNYFLIQSNAVLFLIGYWLLHSVLSVVAGGATHLASIIYDGALLALSLYIIILCSKDFVIERGKTLLIALSLTLILYALRMVFDIYVGPFSIVLPQSQMWNDILLTVGGVFFPTWAMIISRKYINIQSVTKAVFWTGFITCFLAFFGISMYGVAIDEERATISGGLHSLALARLGAIEVIVSLHMVLNEKKKYLYITGLVLGGFIALASGSRGGIAGLVIALGVYMVMGMRKKPFFMFIGAVVVLLFVINLVPILEWLGNYFPVLSNRMLSTVVESDTGERDIYYEKAIQYIKENPIIGFGYRLNSDATGYGAHNGILGILLCLGIPLGLVSIYYLYIKSIICSIRMMINKRFVFICLMVIFSIVSSMSGSSVTTGSFNFSIALLGIAYYYNNNIPIKKKDKKL